MNYAIFRLEKSTTNFVFFLSSRLRQVLLYSIKEKHNSQSQYTQNKRHFQITNFDNNQLLVNFETIHFQQRINKTAKLNWIAGNCL